MFSNLEFGQTFYPVVRRIMDDLPFLGKWKLSWEMEENRIEVILDTDIGSAGFIVNRLYCNLLELKFERAVRDTVENIVNHYAAEKYYNPVHRIEQKRRSREEDARVLASGEKTREQLRKENGIFSFPNAKIIWDKTKLS